MKIGQILAALALFGMIGSVSLIFIGCIEFKIRGMSTYDGKSPVCFHLAKACAWLTVICFGWMLLEAIF